LCEEKYLKLMPDLTFSVDTTGFNQISNKLKGSPDIFNEVMHKMMEQLAQRTQGAAQKAAPHNTGALIGSITYKIEGIGKEVVAKVGTNTSYARYQEEGTGLYGPSRSPIYPQTARVLAWQSGGVMAFARSVRGVQGKHYFKEGLQEAKDHLSQTLKFGYQLLHQRFGM
jgi:hypothetical protein